MNLYYLVPVSHHVSHVYLVQAFYTLHLPQICIIWTVMGRFNSPAFLEKHCSCRSHPHKVQAFLKGTYELTA